MFAAASVATWRNYIRVEDGALYRRDVTRWHPPLLLDPLVDVELCRGGKHFALHLMLTDRFGTFQMNSLRWWANGRELLTLIASAAVGLHLDARTTRRLGRYR